MLSAAPDLDPQTSQGCAVQLTWVECLLLLLQWGKVMHDASSNRKQRTCQGQLQVCQEYHSSCEHHGIL